MERTKLKVLGTPTYTLNVLSKHGVKTILPKAKENGLTFYVSSKDLAKAKRILKDYGRKFEVVNSYGYFFNFKSLKKRYAFLLGLALSVLLVFCYSTLLTDVQIIGANYVDEASIKEVAFSKLKTPTVLRQVDLEGIENEVLKVDGVAFVSAKKNGRSLYIEIVEELPKTPILDTQNFKSLTATEKGTVSKIVVYGGTPLVKIGDEVELGTELIVPYILGADGTKKPTLALGKIELKVVREESLSYESEESFNAEFAREFEVRTEAYERTLKENEEFLSSRFVIKKLDKNVVCSIYYDIIVRLN